MIGLVQGRERLASTADCGVEGIAGFVERGHRLSLLVKNRPNELRSFRRCHDLVSHRTSSRSTVHVGP
jgi:hypothetical protein